MSIKREDMDAGKVGLVEIAIRRDKERADVEAFERLKAELTHASAAPEGSYTPMTAAEVIGRNRR